MALSGSYESIDGHMIRVPFEALRRAAKDRKNIVDAVAAATSELLNPGSGSIAVARGEDPEDADCPPAPSTAPPAPPSAPGSPAPPASTESTCTRETHLAKIDSLLVNLQGLKRKLEEVSRSEAGESHRCRCRLENLQALGPPPRGQIIPWNRQRLDRILVDHLLRRGHDRTAEALTREAGIGELCDTGIFREAGKVVSAIRAHDCSAALEWCSDNRPRLKKIKSKLEFRLRIQEFIELVRREQRVQAIHYARQYLAPWAPLYMQELQRAVATLAFTRSTSCAPYRQLFAPSQWDSLSDLFLRDLFKIYCLPQESLLMVHLQAGLSALKTPQSYQAGCSREDPLHLPTFQRLAQGLPFSKHVRSKLICSVTRNIMDDANPPMVLPNGYVYSARAVEQMLEEGDGRLTCPVTHAEFSADELRRAFIV